MILFSFIVGTGSAGAVLAENLTGRILVIEAGNSGGALFNIPILQPLIQRSSYDWRYETVPQQNSCFGLKNNISFWPAGKILGGSHALNNMIYHRGHREDYYNILNGVSQSQIEKYFEQNEEMVPVSETKFKSTIADAWIKTGKAFQYYSKLKYLFHFIENNNMNLFRHLFRLHKVNSEQWSSCYTFHVLTRTSIKC